MERPKNSRALQNQVHLYLLLPLLEQHPIEVGLELVRLPIPGDSVDVQRYTPVTLVKVIESELVEIGYVFMLQAEKALLVHDAVGRQRERIRVMGILLAIL